MRNEQVIDLARKDLSAILRHLAMLRSIDLTGPVTV